MLEVATQNRKNYDLQSIVMDKRLTALSKVVFIQLATAYESRGKFQVNIQDLTRMNRCTFQAIENCLGGLVGNGYLTGLHCEHEKRRLYSLELMDGPISETPETLPKNVIPFPRNTRKY